MPPERAHVVHKFAAKLGVEVLPVRVRGGKLVQASGKVKDGAKLRRARESKSVKVSK